MILLICCDSPGRRKASRSSLIASATVFYGTRQKQPDAYSASTHVLTIEQADVRLEHVYIIWLRNEVSEQSLVQPRAVLQEHSQTVWPGLVRVSIDELVVFQERDACLWLRVEARCAGQD